MKLTPIKMRKAASIFFLLLIIAPLSLFSQKKINKSDIRVLIVAHNPDSLLKDGYGSPVSSRYAELAKSRGQEYRKLLEPYFKTVETMNSSDYHYTMSNDYDVTIMDDLPKPIETVDMGEYRNGKSIIRGDQVLTYNRYIPDDFDRAIIMTGLLTDDMTYIGSSKFLTQCHCLNAHAFNIKTDHEIFNTPYQVKLPYENRETPKLLKRYYSGVNLPNEMDMWRVQIESPEDGNGYMIGQILVGMGFDDSPDCEFISGGHTIKDITGMALGRSGNIFHWGFSGSPDFMTDSAKKVFINTVFYMSQFNGKKPIVTMYKAEGRNWIDEFCFQKTGHLIDHKNKTYPTPKNEADTLVKYYTENYDYFINSLWSGFEVDRDAKSLEIPNNNIQLLNKSIELLESNNDTEKALRILKRYTDYDFNTATEWRDWFNTYKEYLFFTELGGYKFKIDSWNHPELEASLKNPTKKIKETSSIIVKNNDDEELTAEVELKMNEESNYTLEISFNIKEGWRAYAKLTPETNYFIPTQINLVLPDGSKLIDEMIFPETHSDESLEGVEVYKGNSVFSQKLMIDEESLENGELTVIIDYQICNDYTCKMPNTKELIINLKDFL